MRPIRRAADTLLLGLALLALVVAVGTATLAMLESWSLLDAFYFTTVFVSTIGLGDIHPITAAGKLFSVFLAVCGVGLVIYTIGQFTQIMVETQLRDVLGRRRLERAIKNLKHHYIICGYGRVGSLIARELQKDKVPFVILERDPEVVEKLVSEGLGYLFLHADATDEKILRASAVEHARGLVTVTSHDAENVYIVLTARDINPKIHLISVASDDRSAEKLRRAGADLVISPSEIGGRRIVQGILRPSVMDFIDLAVYDSNLELQMEQLNVEEKSPLANSSLSKAGIRQNFDVIILGIKTAAGEMLFNPRPEYEIRPGDTLIALGKRKDVERMAKAYVA